MYFHRFSLMWHCCGWHAPIFSSHSLNCFVEPLHTCSQAGQDLMPSLVCVLLRKSIE